MPFRARDGGQVLEQQRADAAPLVLVGDRERDLGAAAARPVATRVAADADDPLVAACRERRDQRHVARRSRARVNARAPSSLSDVFAPKKRR